MILLRERLASEIAASKARRRDITDEEARWWRRFTRALKAMPPTMAVMVIPEGGILALPLEAGDDVLAQMDSAKHPRFFAETPK